MLTAVPQVGRRSARVARDRNHLEVAALHVPRGERPGDRMGAGDLCALVLVAEEWRAEGAERALARDVGLVPVVQVVTGDPAALCDRAGLVRHRGGAVDEQVALLALQQDGPDVGGRGERKRLRRGSMK